MAAKSTLTNMAICLTAVCLVCSSLLAFSYALTKEPIDEAQKAKTTASIAEVLPAFTSEPSSESAELEGVTYSYYKVPDAGYAILSTVTGFGGPLTLMVGIDESGLVYNTKVLSHSETPGLGAKCQTDTKFIDQFKGWNPEEKTLAVRKDGGAVDAITASTITSRAYTLAIANAVKVYKQIAAPKEGEESNE